MGSAPTSFIAALNEQLVKPGGLAMGFTALALSLIAFFVLPDWRIPAQALVAIVVVSLGLLWVGAAAMRDCLGREATLRKELAEAKVGNRYAPKVIQAMVDPLEALTLLLEPNRLFGQSMLVSVYYEDERGFELLVASGQVANVQSNGMLQISITSWEEAYDEVRRGVMSQEATKLARLLVRPAPTRQLELAPGEAAMRALFKTWIESQYDDRSGQGD